MPQGIEYIPLLLALVNIAVSIPLVMRKVRPNLFYGFRTRKTLSDPNIWYEANAVGGQALITASTIAALCWPFLMAFLGREIATFVNLGIVVATTTVALIYSLFKLRQL
jgi:uncharacterized membrane protein